MKISPLVLRITGLTLALAVLAMLWSIGAGRFHTPPTAAVAPLSTTSSFGALPAVALTHTSGPPFAGWHSLSQPALLMTFWASWCSVCLTELPAKLAYAQSHPKVALIAISIDTNAAAMQRAITRLNPPTAPNIIWLHDTTQAAFKAFQCSGVPETFVANAQRQILAKQNGPISLKWGPLATALATAQN